MNNELHIFDLQRFAQDVVEFAAKNYDEDDGVIYNARSTAMTITADYENTELSYEDYEDSVVNIDASKTIYGIEITGNENNNSIKGGSGDDILDGGEGDDTLTGGRGNDTFRFRRYEGNDVITDYKSGEDTIEIAEGTISDYKAKGSDAVFNIGSNTLTVKNGSGKEITVTDENGNTSIVLPGPSPDPNPLPLGVKYNTNQTTLTISKKYEDDEIELADYADTVKTINSTAFNKEFKITANENDNVIKVGKKATTVYGGAGNDQITGGKGADVLYGEDDDDKLVGGSGADTLSGGEGNDTLTGGAGKDSFIYDGNGEDVITDYKVGQDKIYLADDIEIESVTVKGKNVTFNFGDEAKLTIKNGKNKKITLVDEDGEETIVKYKKSVVLIDDDDDERDFVEAPDAGSGYWFAKEDNFATDGLTNIITQTTNSAIDMTELSTDYSSLNKIDNKTFIAQTNNK
ncbi:MAG: hypothetical protein IJ563_09750 [Selenomonadaceae bacterium]|nr:hypothetical protein [Selenomonadaceae bacterium]